jgi:hypothetical protein
MEILGVAPPVAMEAQARSKGLLGTSGSRTKYEKDAEYP